MFHRVTFQVWQKVHMEFRILSKTYQMVWLFWTQKYFIHAQIPPWFFNSTSQQIIDSKCWLFISNRLRNKSVTCCLSCSSMFLKGLTTIVLFLKQRQELILFHLFIKSKLLFSTFFSPCLFLYPLSLLHTLFKSTQHLDIILVHMLPLNDGHHMSYSLPYKRLTIPHIRHGTYMRRGHDQHNKMLF